MTKGQRGERLEIKQMKFQVINGYQQEQPCKRANKMLLGSKCFIRMLGVERRQLTGDCRFSVDAEARASLL